MISRRNLFIILITMGAIFFLFQFSQIVKEQGNHYSENPFASLKTAVNHIWQQNGDADAYEDGEYVLFIGDDDTALESIVTQWANYSKRNEARVDSITSYQKSSLGIPELIIVDSANVNFDSETDTFRKLVESGISVVFANLPDARVIEANSDLMELLGIAEVHEYEVEVEGYHLFEGFLIGGEEIYKPEGEEDAHRQDMDLTLPWYYTIGGTKTYMVGIMDEYFGDYEQKNEYLPAVIWRTSYGSGQVFCVNGDYMSQTAGLGLLSAMVYEFSTYQVYPVVNAQNTLIVNYPLMANENDEEINSIYSRSVDNFQVEVVWPTLVALARQNGLKYTCLWAPKYNYGDLAPALADYYIDYLKLFNEESAEVGASLEYAEGTDLLTKTAYDQDFYDTLGEKYEMTSAYFDLSDREELASVLRKYSYLSSVRTVACDEDVSVPILSYLTDDITLQSLTSDTKNFYYSRDFMLKSVETALGYDNAALNLSEVVWPDGEEDHWENIYDDMSSSLHTYWEPYRGFDQTTLTESDARVRTFLNLSYSDERTDDTITLEVSGRDEDTCYFILRTHGEKLESAVGATYSEIEDYVYLITVNSDRVTFRVKKDNADVTIQ